jgi:hypothetical protein
MNKSRITESFVNSERPENQNGQPAQPATLSTNSKRTPHILKHGYLMQMAMKREHKIGENKETRIESPR